MQRTRRWLLGAGVAAGLAGCLGVEGVEYPDADSTEAPNGDDGVDATDPGDDPGERDDTDDSDPVANEALATATRSVVDDAVWFATDYPDAIATYRAAVRDVVSEIDAVRETVDAEGTVTVEMADRLADAGRDAADRAADALEPHFRPRSRIESRIDRHVEPLRTFAPRDDVDRFSEELSRMRRSFRGIDTRTYTREAFSRDPIHNRLLDRLLSPLPDGDAARDEIRGSAFVEIGLASRGFSTFAHRPYDTDRHDRSRIPRFYGSAFDADRREELRARLGPVPQPEDRIEELFVSFATRPPAGNRPSETFEGWPRDLGGTPAYVQRYPDTDTAAARLSAALDAGSTEGTAPIDPDATLAGSDFSGDATAGRGDEDGERNDGEDEDEGREETGGASGPTRWHRFFHREADGERYGFDGHAGIQYGYVVQAGEFLLATGFSGDAWEERAGWQDRLADGWVVR